MNIAVLAEDGQWEQMKTIPFTGNVYRVQLPGDIPRDADGCLLLKEDILPAYGGFQIPVFINSVPDTLQEINADENVVRINGWNSFLAIDTWEVAGKITEPVKNILYSLGKKIVEVPDVPGLITARIVAAIINEAYFALQENISSREEIDLAMKLGTNYPYGPFEWASLIGEHKINGLLQKLSKADKRYLPAALLTKESKQ